MDKRQEQLGMNPSTASQRLVKDLLFNLVKDTPCFHCGKPLTRETFSIEHMTPWLDSKNPVQLFFDLGNISYSHQSCNVAAGRRPTKRYASKAEGKLDWQRQNRRYDSDKRRLQYERTGK